MKKKLDKLETVNWSAVARQAFARELSKIELMEKLLAKQGVSGGSLGGPHLKLKADRLGQRQQSRRGR
jgi:hypothetical protein